MAEEKEDPEAAMKAALEKTGVELFRELFRIYPMAEVEDYFKLGQWRDDLMRTDLQLIDAHRREAGAPDPPPIEEVPMPQLPQLIGLGQLTMHMSPSLMKPVGALLATAEGSALKSVAPAGSPLAELRLIALFVAKWKLDPTRTKSLLGKLSVQRRRYVIQNFKTETSGLEATEELEKYVAECEKTSAWGSAPPVVSVAPAKPALASTVRPLGNIVTPRPVVAKPLVPAMQVSARPLVVPAKTLITPQPVLGIKRPLSAVAPVSAAFAASKRPRLIGTIAQHPPAVAAATTSASIAARLAAVRPRAITPRVVTTTAAQPYRLGGVAPGTAAGSYGLRPASPAAMRPAFAGVVLPHTAAPHAVPPRILGVRPAMSTRPAGALIRPVTGRPMFAPRAFGIVPPGARR